MTGSPATPPLPERFGYQALWARVVAAQLHVTKEIADLRAMNATPARSLLIDEIKFRQIANLIDLIMSDAALRAHVRDVAIARQATLGDQSQQQTEMNNACDA